MSSALDTVAKAWGGLVPKWVITLAKGCDAASQARVAERIGYTPAVVSLVLQKKYSGSLKNVERAVRLAMIPGTVDCPVLGEISEADCAAYQAQPFSATNSMRVRLFKACRKCEHREV